MEKEENALDSRGVYGEEEEEDEEEGAITLTRIAPSTRKRECRLTD